MHSRVPAIVAAVAGVVFVIAAARLNAQQPRALVDCAQLAAFAGQVAEYRELDASLSKVIDKIRRDNPSEFAQRVLVREAQRVYALGLGADQAAYEAYRRCQQHLGRIPLEG